MSFAHDAEVARIRAEYARRASAQTSDIYAPDRPANLFNLQAQERELLFSLARAGMLPLAERRILEVGCGAGRTLGLFARLGADPSRLAGIDLDESRLATARGLFPEADLRSGDASKLPWDSGTFDIVAQFTVFTSILDAGMRALIAQDMRRVLSPGGLIVWYDFAYDNPRNPHVRGVGRRAIRALFPGCRVEIRPATLAPPLARRLVPHSWALARGLEALRVLNTHYFADIRKA